MITAASVSCSEWISSQLTQLFETSFAFIHTYWYHWDRLVSVVGSCDWGLGEYCPFVAFSPPPATFCCFCSKFLYRTNHVTCSSSQSTQIHEFRANHGANLFIARESHSDFIPTCRAARERWKKECRSSIWWIPNNETTGFRIRGIFPETSGQVPTINGRTVGLLGVYMPGRHFASSMPTSSVSLTGNAVSACNLIDDGWNFD